MNWMLFHQMQALHSRLAQTEQGQRLLQLQEAGRQILTKGVLKKQFMIVICATAIAGLITFMIPSIRQNTAVVVVMSCLIFYVVAVTYAENYFISQNERKAEFQKIQSELEEIIGNNPDEKVLVERISTFA